VKIFISWSGDRGQHFATALRDWLPLILPEAKPWTSAELRRGANWSIELLDTLREARACLFCVTADGLDSTWEFFEAGMLCGSDEDPVLTRCLCLDVPPEVLAGGPLATIPAVGSKRADLLGLLAEINALLPAPLTPGELETRYEQAREFFNARMTTLPESRPRRVSVVVATPQGLCPIEVASAGETLWPAFVDAVLDHVAQLVSVPIEDLNLEWCLDLDGDAWVVPPSVVAQLKAKRLAFVPCPDNTVESPENTAFFAALQLRQLLDITPLQQRAMAAMRRDLKDLAAGERAFYEENARYGSLNELEFYPSPGTSIDAEHTATGFHAIAKRADLPAELAIRLGDGAGHFQDEPEGTEFIRDFSPTKLFQLTGVDAGGSDDSPLAEEE
jgi:hypothetical protein